MPPIYIGNQSLLNLSKTAFLSSRKITSNAVLKCYDWATEMRDSGVCVISGFSSKLEKDVFQFLSKGTQPIVVVFARKPYSKVPAEFIKPLEEDRLLMIFLSSTHRQTEETATKRNQYIIEQAEKIVIGSMDENGMLFQLIRDRVHQKKEVIIL